MASRTTALTVRRTERLTPHMIRIVTDLDTFQANEFTDAYVKVLFPVPGVDYPEPFDLDAVRADYPREHWPRMRTYTVRHVDHDAGELAFDFVVHGDAGLAGPWASSVRPGDRMMIAGPGGAYAPRADADWHLLVGDESALPAIAAALEAMPSGALVHAFVLVEDAAEEQHLATKADLRLRWLYRGEGGDPVEAVRGMDWPGGAVQAFVHGEADFVRALRRHLLNERGVDRELLSLSGYWRRGLDDEGWRAEKFAEQAQQQGS